MINAGIVSMFVKALIPLTVDEVAKRIVKGIEEKGKDEKELRFLSKDEFEDLIKKELKPVIPDKKVYLVRRISLSILLFLVFISEVFFPILSALGLSVQGPDFSPELIGLLLTLSFSPNPQTLSTALTGLFSKRTFKQK